MYITITKPEMEVLLEHVEHNLVVGVYDLIYDNEEFTIECEDCQEILVSVGLESDED
jgi:hypothetical protein